MNWNLSGKKALVTGGTKGIGLAIAQEFLELGAEVLVVARDTKNIQGKIKNSAMLFTLEGDVTNPDFRSVLVQKLEQNWGRLDVLVNNVGTNIRKNFADYSESETQEILSVNLLSLVEITRSCHPFLKASGKASVINISSVAGSFDIKSGAPYAMSKAAILQLSRTLAGEWAQDNIRVNTISPWYTRTPLAAPVLAQPDKLAKIIARTPLGRIAEPEEIASVAAFLAMDISGYVTGQNINVDGGMSIMGL